MSTEQQEQPIDIRNKQVPPTLKSKERTKIDEQSEQQDIIQKAIETWETGLKALKTSLSNEKRKSRNFRYNKRDLDETKKDEAFNLLHKALQIENVKPNMIKHFFHDNELYFPLGYTKTEIAIAYTEHEEMEDEWELRHVKDRVHMWISKANTELNARITWTKLEDGRKIYHIAKHGDDLKGPMSTIEMLTGRLLDSHDNKRDLKREIEKENEHGQKQSQEIIVTTEGTQETGE